MRRRTSFACAVFLAVFSIVSAPASRGATPEQIEAAIAKGQEFLLKKQNPGGRWETDPSRKGDTHAWQTMQGSTFGGYTALMTYALLASGKSPQDPKVESAINFLKTADMTGTYAVGMRAQVWTFLPRSPETLRLFRRDAEILLRTLNTRGVGAGMWDYEDTSTNGPRIDHSCSQYGVLGLWACAQAGVPVDNDVWTKLDTTWREHQGSIGGWSYDGDGKDGKEITHSMTAAGIATLYITMEFVPPPAGLNCTGEVADPNIEKGMRWFTFNFKNVNPRNTYLWYGIERIGAASGRRYFGDQDWYEIGAEALVKSQDKQGAWQAEYPGASPITDTAFALLFLARGRAPVVVNKLDYSSIGSTVVASADWNQRPRDVASITRWIGRQGERYLGWEVANLRKGYQDLLNAPILYISGSGSVPLDDSEIKTLKDFIEAGGLVLGNADCGKEEFSRAFKRLGNKMFPDYEFRQLPANHIIFEGEQFRADKWKEPVEVEGLSNGSRELMLLVPTADAGRAWQQPRGDKLKEHLYQFGANVYLYATEKRYDRVKGETYLVEDDGVPPLKPIKVARLILGKDSDPEPGGWRRLHAVANTTFRVGALTTPVQLGDGKLSGVGARVAHLTGTKAFELNSSQREELRKFVAGGGLLVIDAAGGSNAFATSAEKQLAETFAGAGAEQLKSTLPANHPLFANAAAPIKKFGYRPYAMQKLTGGLKAPRLRAITTNGKLSVIFSREDLSTGMVGEAVDGIIGYDPETATAIMRNVMLYAAGIDKPLPPSKRPTTQLKRGTVGDGLD